MANKTDVWNEALIEAEDKVTAAVGEYVKASSPMPSSHADKIAGALEAAIVAMRSMRTDA